MTTDYRHRLYDSYLSSLAGRTPRVAAQRIESVRPSLGRVIARHFPPDRAARIIDLGCGSGLLLHLAKEAGYTRLEGIDVSPEQVSAAHALGLPWVREGDVLESLRQAPDATYDATVSFDVLEHYTKDELLPIVDEVRRVLKPGGRWIIHVPNAQSPFGMSIRYGDFTHEQAFTPNSLTQVLSASGFASVECFEDTPVPHGLKSAGRWVVWKGVKGVLRLWHAAETGEYGPMIVSRNMLAVAVT